MSEKRKAYLILENGDSFEGEVFGAIGEVTGETVFNTCMVGYTETITDPGNYGKIVVQTFPLIGNYGIMTEDFESKHPTVAGYIVRQWCQDPSNFRSEGDLDAFLRSAGIIGISGIDTRRLTRVLRRDGVMNGRITARKPDGVPPDLPSHRTEGAVAACSVPQERTERGSGTAKIALLDLGTPNSLVKSLLPRASEITLYPYDTDAQTVLAAKPDGIVISGAPGDPAELPDSALRSVKLLADSGTPLLGVNLGHLALALAHGFGTEKMKYGHRGANQPARDTQSGRTYITTQNHGYAVEPRSVDPKIAIEWLTNVNDGTNEGIIYAGKPVISAQFHPEPAAERCDTSFVTDRFLDMIKGVSHAAR